MEFLDYAGVMQVFAAGILTWILLKLLHPVAPRLNLLDYPKGRKDHAQPTAITGGLAMMGALVLVATIAGTPNAPSTLWAFLSAATLLVAVGLLDDRYDVRWYWRVLAQAVAALIMIYGAGVRVEQIGPVFGLDSLALGYLSVPFTVFATIGIINAINMIDGADGLSGSLVAVALVMLAAAGLYAGNVELATRALIFAAAVTAFLSYNMRFPWQPQARAFLGNAGSALLGLVIAWVAFRLTQNSSHPVNPVLALWLVPVPIMDCLVLTVRRTRQGRSPFSAGRDHIHHFMQDAGFGPTQAALALAFFSLLCGLAAGQAMRLDIPHPAILAAYLALCCGWYWMSARRQRAIAVFAVLRRLPVFGPVRVAPPALPPPPLRNASQARKAASETAACRKAG